MTQPLTTKLLETLLTGNEIHLAKHIMSFLLHKCDYCQKIELKGRVIICPGLHLALSPDKKEDEHHWYCDYCLSCNQCDGCDDYYPDCDECKSNGYELESCGDCDAHFCEDCMLRNYSCDDCDERFCCRTMYMVGGNMYCDECVEVFHTERTPKID